MGRDWGKKPVGRKRARNHVIEPLKFEEIAAQEG
jgi:hypothetical protein